MSRQAIDLGVLPDTTATFARAVNSSGVVAGFAVGASGATAFVGSAQGLQDIGALGAAAYGYVSSYGLVLNESGQIAGNGILASGAGRAWRYSNGQLQDLGTLGGNYSSVSAINASGQVAGRSFTATGGDLHVFVSDGSSMADRGNLGGIYLEVGAINNNGVVVGFANTATANQAYTSNPGGSAAALRTLGGRDSFATDINNGGAVVGWAQAAGNLADHAFINSGTGLLDLHGDIGFGGENSRATAINDAGSIVGWASTSASASPHAFLLQNSPGNALDLGTLGGGWSLAYGINARGQVWGESARADGTASWFVYEDGQLRDLQDELTGLYGLLGEPTVVYATLSDAGHIAGSVQTADGEIRSFLLSPVPEPQVAEMLLVALACWFGRRAYRHLRAARGMRQHRHAWTARAVAALLAGGASAGGSALAADAPPWAQVQLQGRIDIAEPLSTDPVSFDLASWQGRAFSLTLTLPNAVQQSGQVPLDDIPGAVSTNWQMAWIDSALLLGAGERHAARAYSFQGVSVIDDVTVPAGIDLAGQPFIAGRRYDVLQVWASELGSRCAHPGADGVCSGYFNQNDDPLNGGSDPIDAIFDPTEVWEGLTVEWMHTWDTTQQQGFSGSAFPALLPGGLDLNHGWGVVSIQVWRITGDAMGAPVVYAVGEAQGVVQQAVLQAMQPVPEPASAALLAMGLATLAIAGRRRRRAASPPTST